MIRPGARLTIRIAESDQPDPLCPDPTGELAQTLGEVADPDVLLQYIMWLAPRDVDKALSVSCLCSAQIWSADVVDFDVFEWEGWIQA